MIIDGLNMKKIPPDWDLATKHAKARETKPEKDKHGTNNEFEEVCECCGYELERVEINLFTDSIELGFLGAGFPLFYNYIQYCCIMLGSLFIIQGIPNIIMNYRGNFCDKTMLEFYEEFEENKHHPQDDFIAPCPIGFTNKLSIANILDTMKGKGSATLHFSSIAMIVQIILSVIFRKKQKEIEIQVDKDNITPSDYTVWVKNIPQHLSKPKDALKMLFSDHSIRSIKKIVLVYDITEIEEKERQVKKYIKKKQEYLRKNDGKSGYPEETKIENQIAQLESEISELEEKIGDKEKNFSGSAFVSFESEKEKEKVFSCKTPSMLSRIQNFCGENYDQFNDQLHLDGYQLMIVPAPEPNDLDWEFLHCSTKDKFCARLRSFLLWIALIGVSFSIICLITYFQSIKIDHINEELLELEKESKHGKVDKHEEQLIQKHLRVITLYSFIISCSIVLFNKFALPFIVHQIVDTEKWSTKTKLNISFAFKLTIALFFNTALITFLVEIILFNNFYGIGGGMIYNEELVFVFNAFIPSLAWIIDPWSIIKNYKRKKELQNKEKSVLTQAEANELMEHPDYAMGKRYADIMKTMWFTFFFSPVIPIGTFFSFFGLIFYYYTDKYNLIYRRTVKESIGADLSFEMIELQEYSVILHCLGNFMFKWMLSKYFDITSLILFLISIVVTILPMGELNNCIFKFDKKYEDTLYTDAQNLFDTDYDRENPITKHKALQSFAKERVKSQNQIKEDQQKSDPKQHHP